MKDQEVVWNKDTSQIDAKLLGRLSRQYGEGPFTVVEVQKLSPEFQEHVPSPYLLVLKDLDGNILLNNMRGTGVFNASFFTLR
ncbi:MAG: hypothetical protein KA104_02890 [Candidatus Pacebacteria bacterium]|nr:hypothetical protein [Candidatus Paceibacterota bacterium]